MMQRAVLLPCIKDGFASDYTACGIPLDAVAFVVKDGLALDYTACGIPLDVVAFITNLPSVTHLYCFVSHLLLSCLRFIC